MGSCKSSFRGKRIPQYLISIKKYKNQWPNICQNLERRIAKHIIGKQKEQINEEKNEKMSWKTRKSE